MSKVTRDNIVAELRRKGIEKIDIELLDSLIDTFDREISQTITKEEVIEQSNKSMREFIKNGGLPFLKKNSLGIA